MPERREQENRQTIVVLSIIFIVQVGLLYQPTTWDYDPSLYYAYIRSPVIDGDLDFCNEAMPESFWSQVEPTVTGRCPNPWAAGSAILWAPFFLAAHVLTLVANQIGLALAADGYSTLYVLFVGLSSAFYGLLGVWFVYRWLRGYFAHSVALLAACTAWLASPVLFYMYRHSMFAHATTLFSTALFLLLWDRTREETHWARFAGLGAAAGLAAIVRWQNALLILLPALELAASAFRAARNGQSWGAIIRFSGVRLAGFGVSALLVFSPQMVIWNVLYGSFLTIPQGGGFVHWTEPNLWGVLLSSNRGLLWWQPLALLGVIGLVAFCRRQRFLVSSLLLIVVLQLYINSVVWDWWGGGGFGPRRFDSLGPILALGLAELLRRTWTRRIWLRGLAVGACLFLVLHQRALIWLAYQPDFPWQLYWTGQPIPAQIFVDGFWHLFRRPWLLLQVEAPFAPSPFHDLYAGLTGRGTASTWMRAVGTLAYAMVMLALFYLVSTAPDSDRHAICKRSQARLIWVLAAACALSIVGIDVTLFLLA